MKRDLDLIRKMLLAPEEGPSGYAPDLEFDNYTGAQVGYHAYLLFDAGLALGTNVTTYGSEGPEAIPQSLTREGHEFVEASRNDTRWHKTKSLVAEKGGSVPLDIMETLLISLTKNTLGIP